MSVCKFCGKELANGAAFCDGCGAIVEDDRISCLSCGEKLDPGTTLCPVCGARIYNSSSADGPAEMEALVPPVITDDMFASASPDSGASAVIESADESGYMSTGGVQRIPEPVIPDPAAQAPSAPPPVQTKTNFTPKPQVAPLLNRPHRPAPAEQEAQPAPVIPDSYRQPSPQQPYQQQQQLFQQQAYKQGQFEEVSRPAAPGGQPQYQQSPYQQPPHNPYPDPRAMRVEEGKKGHSLVVPIILIILIIAVILVDVFVLFRERIFGKDDDKSSKKSISVVTVTDLLTEPEN